MVRLYLWRFLLLRGFGLGLTGDQRQDLRRARYRARDNLSHRLDTPDKAIHGTETPDSVTVGPFVQHTPVTSTIP